jgi:hypothetical protein
MLDFYHHASSWCKCQLTQCNMIHTIPQCWQVWRATWWCVLSCWRSCVWRWNVLLHILHCKDGRTELWVRMWSFSLSVMTISTFVNRSWNVVEPQSLHIRNMPALHLEYPKLISPSSYLNRFLVHLFTYLFIHFFVLLFPLPCLLNSLGQPKYERNGHLNFFTVWWISKCLTSLSLRLNALGQCWKNDKPNYYKP